MIRRPKAILFDYGETLVKEVRYDNRAATQFLLTHATNWAPSLSLETILERADRISKEVSARRDETGVETPWPALTRLIYDYYGIEFDQPLEELELPFWNASAVTSPMPAVAEALNEFERDGIPMGIVSNSAFRSDVLRAEIDKHSLGRFMSVMIVSAEYSVRKPNPLLFEIAAARLGVAAEDIWFVGDRRDTDVAGARAAGMTTVWFGATGREGAEPHIVATTWGHVIDAYRATELATDGTTGHGTAETRNYQSNPGMSTA
jgi:putative hydrolase of the HAD superfamily